MDEIWKPIPDTDYAVSNTGKVASMKKGWREIKPFAARGRYSSLSLSVDGKVRCWTIHRLVAASFLQPQPTPLHEINHVDGDKHNNTDSNLEWVTRSENAHHRYDVLKKKALRGESHGNAKLTETNVRDIRSLLSAGLSKIEIAKKFGVSDGAIRGIASGKKWSWLE